MSTSHILFSSKKFVIIGAAICCLLWGSAYPAIKLGYELFQISVDDVPSKLVFAGYRFFFAGFVVLIYASLINKSSICVSKKAILPIIVLGTTQTAIQYVFFYVGLAHTTGSIGSILNATSTFFSVLLAHFIYRQDDRLSSNKIWGCLIGFLGVMIVNLGAGGEFHLSFALSGEGFILISAFLLSATAIYGKKLSEWIDPVVLSGYQLTFGGFLLTLVGYISGGELIVYSISSIFLMIYMVLLSSIAFALWTLLLKYNRVSQIAPFNFLIPVSGTVLSAIFLREDILAWQNLIALFLVCIGIWLVNRVAISRKREIN